MLTRDRRPTALALLLSGAAGLAFALAGAATPARAETPTVGAGAVLAWGSDTDGQLGIGSSDAGTHVFPTAVGLPADAGPALLTSSSQTHTLFVTTTGLYAAGLNSRGELGVAWNSGSSTPVPVPQKVTLPNQVGAVSTAAAGNGFSLVLTSSGQLYTFGDDSYYALGRSTAAGVGADQTPTIVPVPDGGVATMISSGFNHSLLQTSKGHTYAFGYNADGELGAGDTSEVDAIRQVKGLPASPVSQLSGGGQHSLILLADGTVYGFGDNSDGQLASTPSSTPVTTPIHLTSLPPGVQGVSAGGSHSVATENGRVITWGSNQYGQLGRTTVKQDDPAPGFIDFVSAPGRVTSAAATAIDTYYTTSAGTLVAFGADYYGQLGRAPNSDKYDPHPTVMTLPAGTTVDPASSGRGQSLFAIVSDVSVAQGSFPAGTVGQPYAAAVTVSGGLAPTAVTTVTGLPAGLAASPTGITGTPTAAGSSSVTVTVTDAGGVTASSTLPLTVGAAGDTFSVPRPAPPGAGAPTPPGLPGLSGTVGLPGTTGVPSAAAIMRALVAGIVPMNKGAAFAVLSKKGYSQTLTLPAPGRVTVTWTYRPPGRHTKPLTLATGTATFTHPGSAKLTVRLTRTGTALLKLGHRLPVTFTAALARLGQRSPTTASRTGHLS